jgi:NAD-dependent deacetylase
MKNSRVTSFPDRMPKAESIENAAALLAEAEAICVLTGAGISAESGIRTFRDAGGFWEEHAVEDVATPEGFARDPALVWRFYNARRKAAHAALPNTAHQALARLEAHADSVTILTQNIDGLHQRAGSRHVVELHGSIWKVRCTDCGEVWSDFPVELLFPPRCLSCEGLLRPHVVWFGEMLDSDVLAAAEQAAEHCDLFLVIGTSAIVQPAASYPFLASRRGVPVIEVNKETTPVTAIAAVSLLGKAGEILPRLIE